MPVNQIVGLLKMRLLKSCNKNRYLQLNSIQSFEKRPATSPNSPVNRVKFCPLIMFQFGMQMKLNEFQRTNRTSWPILCAKPSHFADDSRYLQHHGGNLLPSLPPVCQLEPAFSSCPLSTENKTSNKQCGIKKA